MSAVLRDGLGIIVGHLYHFLVDIVPKVYRVSVLKTPQLLIDIVEIHVPKMMSWFTGRPVAGVQYQPDWRRSGGYRLN